MSAVRTAVRKVLNVATNIYFSKIEVRGLKNLQSAGTKTGAIFAGNHPSGLVDPMVIMSAVNLPMSSIAKHSLFSTPVISAFVHAMKAVPVMQPYDPGLPPDKQATAEERKAVISEAKEIFDVEDVIASIVLVESLRIQKN